MKRYAAIAVACTWVYAASVSAQTRPNFAGKWQNEVARTKGANLSGWAEGVNLGSLTLALQGNTLTYTTDGPKPTVRTYKLDGSEQQVSEEQGTARVSARWEGSKVVIVTTRNGPSGQVKSVSEYALDGDALVITTTAPPRGGGATMTNKVYYKRS